MKLKKKLLSDSITGFISVQYTRYIIILMITAQSKTGARNSHILSNAGSLWCDLGLPATSRIYNFTRISALVK